LTILKNERRLNYECQFKLLIKKVKMFNEQALMQVAMRSVLHKKNLIIHTAQVYVLTALFLLILL